MAFDLDDEELKATRKLLGVDKENSIEEDIKILEKFNPGDEYTKKIKTAIEHILTERKQDKSRIQELEEEKKTMCEEYCPKTERIKELEAKLEFKKWGDLDNVQFEEYMNQFIPKQKAKEKIEENNIIMINMQNRHPDIYVLSDEWRNAKAQNKVLEELLEDKNESKRINREIKKM